MSRTTIEVPRDYLDALRARLQWFEERYERERERKRKYMLDYRPAYMSRMREAVNEVRREGYARDREYINARRRERYAARKAAP